MPTYQYACTSCGEQLEAVQKFTDDPLTVCPACQGKLRKVFSAVGIVFKGSGFYRTDSRSGGATGAAAKETVNGSSGAAADSGAKSEGKTEAKSEGKSDGKSQATSDSKPAATSGSAGSGSVSPAPAAGTKVA